MAGLNTSGNFDLASLNNASVGRATIPNKTININQTVVTPDADSFGLNADHRNQDLVERMRRGI